MEDKKKIDIDQIEKEMIDKDNKEEKVDEKKKDDEPEVIEAEAADLEDEEKTSSESDIKEREASQDDQKLIEAHNQLLRLQAEFANYKKRAEKDKKDTIQYANEKLLIEILEVVDNFHRALDSEKEHDSFFMGMKMIFDQLEGILKSFGLEEIESDGEIFDPHLHNAVLMEESEEVESGRIIESLRKGYKLNGKLLRPAMVKVAK